MFVIFVKQTAKKILPEKSIPAEKPYGLLMNSSHSLNGSIPNCPAHWLALYGDANSGTWVKLVNEPNSEVSITVPVWNKIV
jgi:hypothetical protein